jgi:hypothetical protein
MPPELPDLSEFQLDCLRRFFRFEFPIEILRKVLAPLVTFTLEGPGTPHGVKYAAGIPKNPVKVTRADINSAIEKARTLKSLSTRYSSGQACFFSMTLSIGREKMRARLRHAS